MHKVLHFSLRARLLDPCSSSWSILTHGVCNRAESSLLYTTSTLPRRDFRCLALHWQQRIPPTRLPITTMALPFGQCRWRTRTLTTLHSSRVAPDLLSETTCHTVQPRPLPLPYSKHHDSNGLGELSSALSLPTAGSGHCRRPLSSEITITPQCESLANSITDPLQETRPRILLPHRRQQLLRSPAQWQARSGNEDLALYRAQISTPLLPVSPKKHLPRLCRIYPPQSRTASYSLTDQCQDSQHRRARRGSLLAARVPSVH